MGEGSSKKGKVKGYSKKKDEVKKGYSKAIADVASAVQEAIQTVQSQQAPACQLALPGAGSSNDGDQMVQVPLRELQMLHASLGRAFFAASNGHNLMSQLASQCETDGRVIHQAKTIVEIILSSRNK